MSHTGGGFRLAGIGGGVLCFSIGGGRLLDGTVSDSGQLCCALKLGGCWGTTLWGLDMAL